MLQIRKWKNVKKEQKYVIFGPYLTSREHPIGQIPHCMILNQYSIHLKTPGKIWSRLLDNKPKSKPRTLLGLFSPILASKMSIFRSKFWFIIISGSFRRHRTCIMAPIRFQMFFNGLLDVYKSIWVIIFERIRPKITPKPNMQHIEPFWRSVHTNSNFILQNLKSIPRPSF